jgi:hypothetical protein
LHSALKLLFFYKRGCFEESASALDIFKVVSAPSIDLFSAKTCNMASHKKAFFLTCEANGRDGEQGCQMVSFQTKNPNLGKFWRDFEWEMLVYFMTIWNILWPFGIIHCHLI